MGCNKINKIFSKVYNDGGHFIAVPFLRKKDMLIKKANVRFQSDDEQFLINVFNELYDIAIANSYSQKDLRKFLEENLSKYFNNAQILSDFLNEQIKRKLHNLYLRKKRFRRKAYLNKWTHFITITYDDEKMDEETFRTKLRKCLSNLSSRRKWKYMGVFERAPETKRLHFHALIYVPHGEMLGNLTEINDYSTKSHTMQKTISNSFFAERFGRNDFKRISLGELKNGNTITYLLKYLGKTDEKIVYSRDIPTEFYKQIDEEDIAAPMNDFVVRYVLFDDAINLEKCISESTYFKKMLKHLGRFRY